METIKKTNLSEAVAQRLLSLISEGQVEPGGKLPSELELCGMLGVSRTAVREGIKALAGINVLTVLPGRGTFVNQTQDVMVDDRALQIALERETVKDLYEVRSVLDTGIARFAALKADEKDIEACRQALHKMEKSLELDPVDFDLAAEGDEEFHIALCRATHNRLLENISRPIINHAVLRYWKKVRASAENVRSGLKAHRLILQGIEHKDVQAAIDAVDKHLKTAFKNLYGDKNK
ncbi:MAG: FadR family transcriptional regulator [Deltaproteobacteria bacterium]|nr:FadR family transcriptional regulator [Deltaproteobacteria bacterium]